MSEYTEAQIIKHALDHYINRSGATVSDKEKEGTVLLKYKDKVARLKAKYGIK